MDGVLDYKQQQEDEALRRMFDNYNTINDVRYWGDGHDSYDTQRSKLFMIEKDPNNILTQKLDWPYQHLYYDPYGRGEYLVPTAFKPSSSLYNRRNASDNYDDVYYNKVLGPLGDIPPIDSMAVPEWFAQEQLRNRRVDHGEYNDAVNFALDLESHKRDPYEVEAYNREQQSRKDYEGKRSRIHE